MLFGVCNVIVFGNLKFDMMMLLEFVVCGYVWCDVIGVWLVWVVVSMCENEEVLVL